MNLNTSFAKRWPFCPGVLKLEHWQVIISSSSYLLGAIDDTDFRDNIFLKVTCLIILEDD